MLSSLAVLLLKVTFVYTLGIAGLLLARAATPSMRHLICLVAVSGSLFLPLLALAPSSPAAFRIVPIDFTTASNRAVSNPDWIGPALGVAIAVWLSGAAVVLFRLALGYWRISRIRRNGQVLNFPEVPVPFPLFASDVTVPMVAGLFRPAIFMPLECERWPEWQRAAALKHECAHIERGDLAANLVAQTACAIYWFHPLVWVLVNTMRSEQEAACDDRVLLNGFDPANYASALISTARNASTSVVPGCLMTTQTNTKRRIMRVLDSGMARTTSAMTMKGICIAFAIVLIAIGMLSPARADEVLKIGPGISPPRLLEKVDADYSPAAKAAKIEGTVVLSLVVGADGTARDVTVKSGIDSALDSNAVAAVQKWRFRPALRQGEPVSVSATIEVKFRLK